MQVGDRVVRAAFWIDSSLRACSPEARLFLLYFTARADGDGIAELDPGCYPTDRLRSIAGELRAVGQAVFYVARDLYWIWIPRMPGEQPRSGSLKVARCFDRPAPPPEKVEQAFEKLNGRPGSKAELKQYCPRAYGKRRKASGISTGGGVQDVFEAWRSRQMRPGACHLGPAAKSVIQKALKEAPASRLTAFINYAYEADDAGPRYWRGQNNQRRTYLGLDNLLRPQKLGGRLQAMDEYSAKQNEDEGGTLSTLGPMARYKAQSRARLATYPPRMADNGVAPVHGTQPRQGPAGTVSTPNPRHKRLSDQCRTMLELFKQRGDSGVRTNELAEIALKYTGRISEIRGAGYDIFLAERDREGGNNLYILRVQ